MKKYIVIALVVLCIVGIAWARRNYNPSSNAEGLSDGSTLMTSQIGWNLLDTTASGATATDLGVTERTYATVLTAIGLDVGNDGEISYARIPPTWNKIRFRCTGEANGGIITYQIYLGTLAGESNCELVKAAQLAFVIGQQASITADHEMADEVTVTEYCWVMPWSKKNPSGELVAEAAVDVIGADVIFAVPTAANCDCRLLVKGI